MARALSDDLRSIISGRQRTKYRMDMVSAVIFILIGLALMGGALYVHLDGRKSGGLVFIAALVLGGGVLGWVVTKKRFVDIAGLIDESPERIVWVYDQINTARAYGVKVASFRFLTFCLDNKRRVEVRMPAQVAERLKVELQAILPNAEFGYSDDKNTAFNKRAKN